jgi:hypothetical protein
MQVENNLQIHMHVSIAWKMASTLCDVTFAPFQYWRLLTVYGRMFMTNWIEMQRL